MTASGLPARAARLLTLAAAVAATGTVLAVRPAAADGASSLAAAVTAIEALPYQPAYVPIGPDTAFPAAPAPVLNTVPAQDYTSGSIPGSPDAPSWPPAFTPVTLTSGDGARLLGYLALHSGSHPGVVVVHGFNTHGVLSVIRWAAMLYASGYDVLAADQRDFSAESMAGYGYPTYDQTFGWKEAEDVLAQARALRAAPGVTSVGLLGFSEGAQNVGLAAALDGGATISSVLAFSGPADQNQQIANTAVPSGCVATSPPCTHPATSALVALVVPPYTYTDACAVLADAATLYKTTAHAILGHESLFHILPAARIPVLNLYANDDPLVSPASATLVQAYAAGDPLRQTVLIARGNHAYFYDRWWDQAAILTYFARTLPADPSITTTPTVNQTPGGTPLGTQLVTIPQQTRAQVDASLAPDVCDGSAPPGLLTAASSPGGTPTPTASGAAPSSTPATITPGTVVGTGLPNTGRASPAAAVAVLLAIVAALAAVRLRRRQRLD